MAWLLDLTFAKSTSRPVKISNGFYIGLAYVTPELIDKGEFSIRLSDFTSIPATICPTPFYDPDNTRQKAAVQHQEVNI